MNRTPEEKLFDHLSEIDPALLDEAMELDSAEKLQKTVPFTQKPAFRWTAAVAACLAILLAILPILQTGAPLNGGEQSNTPPMLYDPTWPTRPSTPNNPTDPTDPNETLDPPWLVVGTNLSIDSADMLNYYSAIYLLAQNSTGTGASSSGGFPLWDPMDNTEPPYGDIPIYSTPSSTMPPDVDYDYPEPPPPPPWELESEYTEPPANTEGPPVTPPTPPTTPPNTEDDYYEYPIDPDTQFHLTQVIFFRIQLSGDGFLAQTLGTGIVDVVITDFDIFGDYMITFKNGDKYLSCLTNGYGPSEFEFSTHKYIEGFSIIKNGRQINYRFLVTLDGNMQVDHFECDYWDYFNPGNPDGIMPVVGETYIANTDLTFTIDQLETYFRSFKAPTQSE